MNYKYNLVRIIKKYKIEKFQSVPEKASRQEKTVA